MRFEGYRNSPVIVDLAALIGFGSHSPPSCAA